MKVAVNIQTKKIVDLLPYNATANTPFLINNGYIMLDIENPVESSEELEDGTLNTIFRKLTEDEIRGASDKDYISKRQSLVDAIMVVYNGVSYQGNEISQDRMARSVVAMDEKDTIQWVAADNSVQTLTRDDLAFILRMAGEEQTGIWISGR